MSDAAGAPAAAASPSAGRLLREAREKQGLHIAALAASIKVSPKKLELLESDRFDELPDATFTRALAQTVCRALKTDSSAVMRLLPPPVGHRLEQLGGGLNAPFRERPGALVQRDWFRFASNPVFWLVALILVATIAVYLLPASVTALAMGRSAARSAPPPQGAVEPGMPPDTVESAAPTTASPPAVMPAPAPASVPGSLPGALPLSMSAAVPAAVAAPTSPVANVPSGATAGSVVAASTAASGAGTPLPTAASFAGLPPGMLQVRTSSASWVEVTDGRGRPLVSRLVRSGEAIGVDGVPPLKVRIGNAAGTTLVFRGQPTELQAFTRDNVARLELK